MSKIRSEVINAFKKLHRTCRLIFAGDNKALELGRKEINERFKNNMYEENVDNVKKMIQFALDVDKELRTNVIQAKEKKKGLYELRFTEETTRLDNYMFDPNAVIQPPRRKGKSAAANDEVGCAGGADEIQK